MGSTGARDSHPEERLDRSEGSGGVGHSGSEWDQNAPNDDLGYTKTRTKFYGEIAGGREGKSLQQRHDSTQPVSRTEVRDAKRRRDIETWASTFGLTDYQLERVLHLFDKLESKQFGRYPVEVVSLGLIAAVVAEDGRHLTAEETFKEVVNSETDGERDHFDARRTWTLCSERLPTVQSYYSWKSCE